jgi:hypothetical protein
MRKNLVVALCLAVVVAAASTTAFAANNYSIAGSGVTDSRHDINKFATESNIANVASDSQERVCAFCHTPHHAIAGATTDYLPLWSHELTSKNYTPYASNTLDAIIDNDPLVGPSRLCMSCHDGVIAVDTHYGQSGPTVLNGDNFDYANNNPQGSGGIGAGTPGNLANDHPIGFDYDAAQTKDAQTGGKLVPGIRTSDNVFKTVGVAASQIKIQDVLYEKTKGAGKKYMTCATCHEVHNKDNVPQKSAKTGNADLGVNYFLYGSQAGSRICLSCHDK